MKKFWEKLKNIKDKIFGSLRKLYNWVLHWAETPYGVIALIILAFAESSFFPIPPDVLLIALCIGAPKKSYKFALYCSVASVVGGMFGYLIGFLASDWAKSAVIWMTSENAWNSAFFMYNKWGVWFVGAAGFTPIPYKIFTILSGVFKLDFIPFVIISAISRSARFFLVGALIFFFGDKLKDKIEKYFNIFATVFALLLIGGILILKYVI